MAEGDGSNVPAGSDDLLDMGVSEFDADSGALTRRVAREGATVTERDNMVHMCFSRWSPAICGVSSAWCVARLLLRMRMQVHTSECGICLRARPPVCVHHACACGVLCEYVCVYTLRVRAAAHVAGCILRVVLYNRALACGCCCRWCWEWRFYCGTGCVGV
jgi:hypothetical protein